MSRILMTFLLGDAAGSVHGGQGPNRFVLSIVGLLVALGSAGAALFI